MVQFDILNDKNLIAKRDEWFNTIQSMYDSSYDKPRVLVIDGSLARAKSDMHKEPEKWVDECLEDIAKNKASDILNDKKLVTVSLGYRIYGVHFIDKIMGANVYFKDRQWYNDYLTTPIGELEEPDLDNNETFQLAVRAAKRFVEVGGELPIFAIPTIASALNIAVNLYGQEILIEMISDPDNARKDLETINRTLINVHKRLNEIIPKKQLQPTSAWLRLQPPGYGQICGCSTHLISGSLYEEMILYLDEAVLNVYENGGMIHLCGSHSQHIENFRNMKSLKSVQLNDKAAEDLQLYFEGLREDQIIYLVPCKGMPVEKALEITGGKRLVISAPIEGEIKIPQ